MAASVATAAMMATDVGAAGPKDASAEECQGQAATIVGTPDMRRLNGTAGDDVMVTGGARGVFSRGGNDTVCVTRTTRTLDAGRGDDLVTTADGAGGTYTDLGAGDDSFSGGSRTDEVVGGPGSDHATGAGDDSWYSPDETDVADLGDGNDEARVDEYLPPGALDGGNGMNTLGFPDCCEESATWVIDNTAEVATREAEPRFHWDNFRSFALPAYLAGTVEFIGSDEAERVQPPRISGHHPRWDG